MSNTLLWSLWSEQFLTLSIAVNNSHWPDPSVSMNSANTGVLYNCWTVCLCSHTNVSSRTNTWTLSSGATVKKSPTVLLHSWFWLFRRYWYIFYNISSGSLQFQHSLTEVTFWYGKVFRTEVLMLSNMISCIFSTVLLSRAIKEKLSREQRCQKVSHKR